MSSNPVSEPADGSEPTAMTSELTSQPDDERNDVTTSNSEQATEASNQQTATSKQRQ
jgi:hypothetical protein